MTGDQFLQSFINECIASIEDKEKDHAIVWDTIFTILVYKGLKILLPELKEWLKLAASAIALKR